MTQTLSPNDSGEIPPPGETTVRIVGEHRTRVDIDDEKTQRIDPDTIRMIVQSPSFTAIPRRTIDITDTVIYLPQTIGVVDLGDSWATVDGDLRPPLPGGPPPLPPTEPRTPPNPAPPPRVTGVEVKLRRAAPGRAQFKPWRALSRGRHAAPAPLWTRLAIFVGTPLVLGSVLALAALAVIR